MLDSGAHVHRVAAQTVQLCDQQNVAVFKPIEQLGESFALLRRDRSANAFGDDTLLVDGKSGVLDLERT